MTASPIAQKPVAHQSRRGRPARARKTPWDDRVSAELAEAFGALADPNRVKIIYRLLDGEWSVGELARVLNVSDSAVSQHLRLLRTLRWVRNRRAGRMVFYSLDDEHVSELLDIGLRHIEGRE